MEDDRMAKAYSTINTVLKAGATSEALTQLCKIKSYPDLGGSPENLETTDLEDVSQTFVPGVQSVDTMEFTANYTPEAYDSVNAIAGTDMYYELDFGANGANGKFTWQGTHSVRVNGGDVNAVREMTITITPSTAITKVTA
jgi:hypothetical protein